MPLLKSKSKKAFKSNVSELMHSYEEKGSIGTSKPKSKKKAIKQALAIAYSTKRNKGMKKMSKEQLHDFAATKTRGLPKKVKNK